MNFVPLYANHSGGSPLRRLSDELLQYQNIEVMPEEAVSLLQERLGLLLR